MRKHNHLKKFEFQKGQRPWNYSRILKKCKICKKQFLIAPSQINKRFTCSTICAGIAKRLPEDGSKKCSMCKKSFPMTEFKRKARGRSGAWHPYCRKCSVIHNRKWTEQNREYVRTRTRNYMRKYRLGISTGSVRGKISVLGKRDYPKNHCCELCHRNKLLHYHHWNNNDFSHGMWICVRCHSGIHWLEEFPPSLYFNLKKAISHA